MYISFHQAAQARDRTLTNLLTAATAGVDAGQRFAELGLHTGRAMLHYGKQQLDWLAQANHDTPTAYRPPFADEGPASPKLFDAVYEIVADMQRTMIQAAETQVRIVDRLLFAFIDRSTQSSPWEAEIALAAMRSSLQEAEQALHGMTTAAVHTVEMAEEEVRLVADSLAAGAAPSDKKGRRRAA